jgi:hypothetical protein
VIPATLAVHLAWIRGQVPCLDPDPIRTARAWLANGGVAGAAGCPVAKETAASPAQRDAPWRRRRSWSRPAASPRPRKALERLLRDLKVEASLTPDG